MQARNVIMILRALLRDEDCRTSIYSDNLLLDYISRTQNALIREFRENIQTFKTQAKENTDIITPSPIASIFTLTLNDIPLSYAQSATAFKNPPALYHKQKNIYAISGSFASGELELVASFFAKPLEYKEDELILDESYTHALALGAFCELLLIEYDIANPQRLLFYKERFNEEKNALRTLKSGLNPQYLQSRAQM